MTIRKLVRLGSAVVLSLIALLAISTPRAHANPIVCTWTGNGTDTKFDTANNWTGAGTCSSTGPSNGYALVFPSSGVANFNPNNDLPSASFASITITAPSDDDYDIIGNAFTLTGGITDSSPADTTDFIENPIAISGNQTITVTNQTAALELDGALTGSGNISQTGNGVFGLAGNNSGYTGAITVTSGELAAANANAIGTSSAPGATVENGADFQLYESLGDLSNCQLFNFSGNLSLTGGSSLTVGDGTIPKLGNQELCGIGSGIVAGEYGAPTQPGNVTLSGSITLGSNITFAGFPATTTLTGALSGAYSVSMLPGYTGQLIVNSSNNTSQTPNGTYSSALNNETLSDSQPDTPIDIYANNVITVDGTRGDTTVNDGGVLKGDGTVGNLFVDSQSTVSPGHSPGCLTASGVTLNGTYQAEIQSPGNTPCTDYDQLISSDAVDVTGATLDVSFLSGFTPSVGQTFDILKNESGSAITGTFNSLPQGATFTVGSSHLQISYSGGTSGNDVVLTVVTGTIPQAPDTGLTAAFAQPLGVLASSTTAAIILLILARRLRPSLTKR